MEKAINKTTLISGASIAGLSAAWFMNNLGYKVTVVENAAALRDSGAAIDIRDNTVEIVKRMGILEQLKQYSLHVENISFKNADDTTAGSITMPEEEAHTDIEIERDKFIRIVYESIKSDVEFIFNDSITALEQADEYITATFRNAEERNFDLVIGADGAHSTVRRICFGPEADYAHFLQAYFSITTVDKLLIAEKQMQMYNEPDRAITLNAYNGKTDIIFCFYADTEIGYDYRDSNRHKQIIAEAFANVGWRAPELLDEALASPNFYFDKFCQVKMPEWTKGRVALIGDAAYCASPAAGMGGSLAIEGAAALADALQKCNGDHEVAFLHYNKTLRPFIEQVQAQAEFNVRNNFIPRTEEAIRKRNEEAKMF
ncbi:FAD-dependent monooxygenase [Mucilaginibacter pedocola]|uniref:FAD-binding monooxygenase n=1 Tax=Mucilaginibacter pedocola TaxID=1792845 RepID=A0A1S9P6T4_9SPHI|nr:FAD-dependent monooxygenase [Mucilaginibacter pedocola]OOQ56547.1 FAD-binding monooxygenase [Mucilaginibacter pedocola]